MKIGNNQTRFCLQSTDTQFALLPSVGIVWAARPYRFAVVAMWLNVQAKIGIGRKYV